MERLDPVRAVLGRVLRGGPRRGTAGAARIGRCGAGHPAGQCGKARAAHGAGGDHPAGISLGRIRHRGPGGSR
jgi:hypothetical protein